MKNKISPFTIARILLIGLLLFALIGAHPPIYYVFLRWIVFGGCVWGIYLAWEKIGWAIFFGIIALIFNPIFPLFLSRFSWLWIDAIVAIALIISLWKFKIKNDNAEN